jgi:anthraniloyl-CoA monooxygenase
VVNPLSVGTVLCIGGGPAGLYFALLVKKQTPATRVLVLERNQAADTFGWGVVLSDQTLANLRAADAPSATQIGEAFNHWDDIEVFFKERSVRSSGHGFCGIGRQRLLAILQARCAALGVELIFAREASDDQALAVEYDADLIVACDGLNSRIRSRYAEAFKPEIDLRQCRFVWLGTRQRFSAFTFAFERTEHGWFQAHAYQFDADTSTFIIETPESVWQAHGLDQCEQPEAIAFCERLFARYLDGNALMSNASHLRGAAIWIRFPRVICQSWVHHISVQGKQVPVVLMGDAAHTAHFSIGSGTKLALEDAMDLAQALRTEFPLADALQHYQARRSMEVLKIQNAARNSTEWFEHVDRYAGMEIEQFAYSLLTRSQRISHENLRLRDGAWLQGYESWFAKGQAVPPMLTPLTVRGLTLKNRIVVSPMATYSAQAGEVNDFHLVHLGARALGGAGLVFVEMTSPTEEGRITPACTGLWTDAQATALQRVVQFIHTQTDAKAALQVGHSGAKGSTQVGWEASDEPLLAGNWPLLAASAIPYGPNNQIPRAMVPADMQRIVASFVAATQRAARIGFDWLELHCAHGYLLSGFICPLSNHRLDAYGGTLENRCRFPLEVFIAMRAVWPSDRPMSVRISAHDWAPGGNTDDDAVTIARLFKAAGADMIDVSSGQTTRAARPVYGRMYQTPFSDRIRNEVGIQTIAVGAISEADHANSIIAAGRADLCAIARPHLTNPAWTLHEAAALQSQAVAWPKQYWSGRDQRYREVAKQQAAKGSQASAPLNEEG